ncbi:protein CCA1-like isoform X2 [Phalaenopsis equestris]|uniref:protein CCA1-like isoform X2 n=1 Tax=Phalaenopsis equestris TaxID=78828 RepID=UPI0009E54FA8|nr:protein CCA1-like isoform X2 [Phalaenopsis equestris]
MDISNKGAMEMGSPSSEPTKRRKPYTITKQREKWTDEEHKKFLEAICLYGRGWIKIQEHVGTKSATQIRSHAQKFFLKKGVGGMNLGHPNGLEIPPPRARRKPFHPSNEKPVAGATEESSNQALRRWNSYPSLYHGNNSAHPLPEHIPMLEESVKKTGKYLHLFEMHGNFTNPQMKFTSEERNQTLEKLDKPYASPKHTVQGEGSYQNMVLPQLTGSKYRCGGTSSSFIEQPDANADLSLSLSHTSSVTYMTKDPVISSIQQAVPSNSLCDDCLEDENASIALSGFTANSFPKLHADPSTAASLLEHTFLDISAHSDTNINVGKARDERGNISPSIKAIIAATVEAAAAWWRLNGLLPSPSQSSTTSATQTMVQNLTKEPKDLKCDSGPKKNSKCSACSALLEPSSSSSPETVEKIRVDRPEKHPNQHMLSSVVKGNEEISGFPVKKKQDTCSNTSPFTEAVSFGQLKDAEIYSKPYNGTPAFEALFSQNVLMPQSFGLLLMDDHKLDLNLGGKEALELQIDINRKTFTDNVFVPAEFGLEE